MLSRNSANKEERIVKVVRSEMEVQNIVLLYFLFFKLKDSEYIFVVL